LHTRIKKTNSNSRRPSVTSPRVGSGDDFDQSVRERLSLDEKERQRVYNLIKSSSRASFAEVQETAEGSSLLKSNTASFRDSDRKDFFHSTSGLNGKRATSSGSNLDEIFVNKIPNHAKGNSGESLAEVDGSHNEGQGPECYFQRVQITDDLQDANEEIKEVCRKLLEAAKLRDKYSRNDSLSEPSWGALDQEKFKKAEIEEFEQVKASRKYRRRAEPPFDPFQKKYDLYKDTADETLKFELKKIAGVVYVHEKAVREEKKPLFDPPSVREYYEDLSFLLSVVHDAATKSVCYKRLELLEALFGMHTLLNTSRESEEQKKVPHRDFYNVRKVDTHIHHSAIMNQKHLLRFIKHKLKRCASEIVIHRDNKYLTLEEVFRSLRLTAYDLSIDTLDMHADNTFHRFDRFNLKYNPVGESRLREIFLKSDNLISGRYLAEITKEVFEDAEANKYVMLEPRVSIYGRKISEWAKLSKWFTHNELASPNVRWMIQIPRLYSIYKKIGLISNFQEMLSNIFDPLFDVTINPDSDPDLACFLRNVVGFDCVDDESKFNGINGDELFRAPEEWNQPEDPPYSYWMYYLYANIHSLNALRKKVGMNEFSFRPHAGEAGDYNNLAATFLCAESINHGILLRKSPALQYLYYLKQVGLAVSPLSNNKLFLDYHSNPFPVFFARGLNVSLSTDDPLMLHFTKEPLVEEYSCAAQVWKLSSTDMCEIARNSVLQSGFEHPYKAHFLGDDYLNSNDITQTNVSDIRILYRKERLQAEWAYVNSAATISPNSSAHRKQ